MSNNQGRRGYRHQQNIQYLADLPGGRVESDRLATKIEDIDTTLPVEVTNADLNVTIPEGSDFQVTIPEPLAITPNADLLPVTLQEPVKVEPVANPDAGLDGSLTDDTSTSTLPAADVPNGAEVTVQAKHGNASRVKIGLTDTPTVELEPGERLSYQVSNLSTVRVQAKTDGDGVNYTIEQETA
jgi:hypothetical protein